MMTEWQEKQILKNGALTALTAEIAAALGAPWKARPLREDRDEASYPSRWIVNGEGAELVVKIEEYGAKKGRVNIYGSLHIGNEYVTVYENGNRVSSPDISVNPERGVEVIAKEIKRRLIPEYLRVLALAQAKVKSDNEATARRQAAIRKLVAVTGAEPPDFAKERDKDRFYLRGWRSGDVRVSYDGSVNFERLSVTHEEAEYILKYLYRNKNSAVSE